MGRFSWERKHSTPITINGKLYTIRTQGNWPMKPNTAIYDSEGKMLYSFHYYKMAKEAIFSTIHPVICEFIVFPELQHNTIGERVDFVVGLMNTTCPVIQSVQEY